MRKAFVIVAAGLLAGCMSRFNEQHFFAAADPKVDNLFRVKVSGYTLLATSRYLSGYFDESAVDAYFNEFSQPEGGALRPSPSDDQRGAVVPVNADPNTRLVLFLSSNSDAAADQIGAIAQNENVAAALERIINRDQIIGADRANRRSGRLMAEGRRLVANGKSVIDPLGASSTEGETEQAFLLLTNQLAQALGRRRDFGSLEAARQWRARGGGR